MFRAAFHTGYVPCGVLRLTKVQLDGANTDPRFADDFFVDLIFAPIEAAAAGPSSGSVVEDLASVAGATKAQPQQCPSDSGLVIDSDMADKYEQSLHRCLLCPISVYI
jgi:tensin